MRILLVEDDPRISRLAAKGLAEQGHSIDQLALGAKCLSWLQTGVYQCLVLELMLPDMEGLPVLKKSEAPGSTSRDFTHRPQ